MAEVRAGTWAKGLSPETIREPRPAALWILERCLSSRRTADSLRSGFAGRLDQRDATFLHRLTTDVLRWLRRLDDVIEQVGGRPIRRVDPRLLGPLRLGAVQLLLLDRVPAHAAVSTSVDLAAERSRAGARFVNALLRKIAAAEGLESFPVRVENPVDRLAVETSHSRFLVESWVERFGEQRARLILQANNRDRPASLLAVRGVGAVPGLVRRLGEAGVEARPSALSPIGLLVDRGRPLVTACYREGEIYPQDEASQCAALIPPPRPGEVVLDAAASPGGKTLSLLAWERSAEVVAADHSLSRLGRLLANRQRVGATFGVVASDARRPATAGFFDRVIADLPCSGSGTLRKHPELKWRIDAGEIERLAAEAATMLDGLAPLVGSGGHLVIATCSLELEENEAQVMCFLDRHPEFELAPLEAKLVPAMEVAIEGPGRWRLYPEADHDGFTVHLLKRT